MVGAGSQIISLRNKLLKQDTSTHKFAAEWDADGQREAVSNSASQDSRTLNPIL